jgi:divalent metal cation (Fe/Co/Zn/Cd) transporter
MVEVHLLFPNTLLLGEAHRIATVVEERLVSALQSPAEVATHLESLEDHDHVHREAHYMGRP